MGYFKTGPLETPEAGNSPAITGDLKKLAEGINNNFAHIQSGAAYVARKAVAEGVEYEPSATRASFVLISVVCNSKQGVNIVVNAENVGSASNENTAQTGATIPVMLAPGGKFKAEKKGTSYPVTVEYTYLLL